MNGRQWSKEEIDFLTQNFNKMTYKEIAKKLNRTERAIRSMKRKIPNLKLKRNRLVTSGITPELAYIVGVCLGDGCVRLKKTEIILKSIDIEFISFFRDCLQKVLGIKFPIKLLKKAGLTKINNKICFGQTLWGVTGYSKELAKKIIDLKNHNWLQESYEIRKMFFKGFFDSEGSIIIWKEKKPSYASTYRVQLSNTDKNLLLLIKKIGNSIGFNKGTITQFKREYFLNFTGIENLLTLNKIGVTIERKRKKLDEFIKTRNLNKMEVV
jgi:intein-encoded DNA endonuclease-like protein